MKLKLTEHLESISLKAHFQAKKLISSTVSAQFINQMCIMSASRLLTKFGIEHQIEHGQAQWRIGPCQKGIIALEGHSWIVIDEMIFDPSIKALLKLHETTTKYHSSWRPCFLFLHKDDCRDASLYETGSVSFKPQNAHEHNVSFTESINLLNALIPNMSAYTRGAY